MSDRSRGGFLGIESDQLPITQRSLRLPPQLRSEDVVEPHRVLQRMYNESYQSPLAGTCLISTKSLATHRPDNFNNERLDSSNCRCHLLGHRRSCAGTSPPRSQFLRHFEHLPWRAVLWLGPVIEQRRNDDTCSCYRPLAFTVGYGFGFAMTVHRYCPFRIELAGSFQRKWKEPSLGFSTHWNLSLPRILPWESEIVRLALVGDADAVKTSLHTLFLTPFDVLPNGSTLLHVCLELRL